MEEQEQIPKEAESEWEEVIDEELTNKIYNLAASYSTLSEIERESDTTVMDKIVVKKFAQMKKHLFNAWYYYCTLLPESYEKPE